MKQFSKKVNSHSLPFSAKGIHSAHSPYRARRGMGPFGHPGGGRGGMTLPQNATSIAHVNLDRLAKGHPPHPEGLWVKFFKICLLAGVFSAGIKVYTS